MESTNKNYDFGASLTRIDEILDASNDSFEESDSIVDRSKLTYTNGFYVKATALFVDIRDSSNMTDAHKRPVLAKIYRSFISEMVALMNGHPTCKEVNINGIVYGAFATQSVRLILMESLLWRLRHVALLIF